MGVDTRTRAIKRHEFDNFMIELTKALKKGFGDKFIDDSVSISSTHEAKNGDRYLDYTAKSFSFILDYECSSFSNGKECRQMMIHYDYCRSEIFYTLQTGMWGHSEKISKCIVDYFGGYSDFDDCDSVSMDYCKSEHESFLGIIS